MKKNIWKWTALVLALVLIVFLGFFANSMLGNPVSKWLARRSAQAYLNEAFPGTDYVIDHLNFSFKDTSYHAFVESPTSADTYFSICIDMLGKIRYDTYDSVESGWNTYRRLEDEYRALADTIFENPAFPYKSNIHYGTLEVFPREYIEDPSIPDIPAYALVQDDLVLDKVYDICALGAQAGHLVVYVDADTISFEEAARIMLEIKEMFDSAGIPFYAMNFCLQYPLPADGPRPDGDIRVEHFPYSELYEDGLEGRVEAAHHALQAYYDSLDSK